MVKERKSNRKEGRPIKCDNAKVSLYKCQAPGCNFKMRRDNLKRHYLRAFFNENGIALPMDDPVIMQCKDNKKFAVNVKHTKHFHDSHIRKADIANVF